MDPGRAGHATECLYFLKKCQGHEQQGEAEELFLLNMSEGTGQLKTTHTPRQDAGPERKERVIAGTLGIA